MCKKIQNRVMSDYAGMVSCAWKETELSGSSDIIWTCKKRHLHEQQLLPLTRTCEPASFFHSARSISHCKYPVLKLLLLFWTWCLAYSLKAWLWSTHCSKTHFNMLARRPSWGIWVFKGWWAIFYLSIFSDRSVHCLNKEVFPERPGVLKTTKVELISCDTLAW